MKRPPNRTLDFLFSLLTPAQCFFSPPEVKGAAPDYGTAPVTSRPVERTARLSTDADVIEKLRKRMHALETELTVADTVGEMAVDLACDEHRDAVRERNLRHWTEDKLARAEAECARLREEVKREREARADLIGG